MHPRIDLVHLIVESEEAAAEWVEQLTVERNVTQIPVSIFCTVQDSLLVNVKWAGQRGGVADDV